MAPSSLGPGIAMGNICAKSGALRFGALFLFNALILVSICAMPVTTHGQSEKFKEAVRREESRSRAATDGASERKVRATGDSKAHQKARHMLENVRGKGHGDEDYRPMSPDAVCDRMKETEEKTKYFLFVIIAIPALILAIFGLKFFFNVFVKPVVKPIRRLQRTTGVAKPSMSQVRKLVSMAKKHERKGAILDAAQLFEGADEMRQMLIVGRGGKEQEPEERLDLRRAADLYERAREFKKASELQVTLRSPGRTKQLFSLQAHEYETQGKYLLAADMYAKAGDYVAAAGMNEKGGHIHGAAAYYEKVGEKLKAAKLYERFYQEEKADHFGAVKDQNAFEYVRKYALKSARLYAGCGELQKAAYIFSEFSEFLAAGKMFLKADKYIEAVNVLVRCDEDDLLREALAKVDVTKISPELFAKAMERTGDPDAAAEALLKAGRTIEAASVFERKGKHERAAALYEERGDLEAAADLYARAENFQKAADIFLSLNDKKAALEMYRRMGNKVRAAEMRAELGEFFDAARDLLGLGENERAMAMLERVEPSHPDFLDAYRLLGERLINEGQYERVRGIFEPAIKLVRPRSREAKEMYYLLALASIRGDRIEKAKECLEQVLDIDYSFKDASKLYDSLLKGGESRGGDEPEG
ncbi:MAG: hypothetical protein JW941_13190 [Candidatus Coatesbacteria bacterium]|nr:hypothetical protein [Candidatus Coatesbacteria bacterium]